MAKRKKKLGEMISSSPYLTTVGDPIARTGTSRPSRSRRRASTRAGSPTIRTVGEPVTRTTVRTVGPANQKPTTVVTPPGRQIQTKKDRDYSKLPVLTKSPTTEKNFGSFRNTTEGPRKGQAFEVVHRNGIRYHKYASGRLVPDKQAGSSKRIKRGK